MKIPSDLFEQAKVNKGHKGYFVELGVEIGKLYTDHGLPISMALDRLDLTKAQKGVVLDHVCSWLIAHKRASGASDRALDRQRALNCKMVEQFIKTGGIDA